MKKEVIFVEAELGSGGAEKVMVTLANQLVKDGYSVRFCLYGDSSEVFFELDDRITVDHLKSDSFFNSTIDKTQYILKRKLWKLWVCGVRFLDTLLGHSWEWLNNFSKGREKLFNYEMDCIELIRHYLRCHPDAVIISFLVYVYSTVSRAFAKEKRNYWIISERNNPNSPQAIPYVNGRKRAIELADVCVFQTPQAMECLKELVSSKGIVVPNPVCLNTNRAFSCNREKVIVNFCRLFPQKNLPLLIKAFKRLTEDYSDYRLHIFGDGEQREELEHLIEELEISDKVCIFHKQQNIHEIVKNASMFVSSSDYEGLSNSMLEAMALGLPVVCTDCPIGGAAMFIKSFENGILVPVGDEIALYEGMKYMVEHPDEASRMGEKASMIREELSVERITRKWEEIIDKNFNNGEKIYERI